jgi:uncharacterized protein (DUF433 family)
MSNASINDSLARITTSSEICNGQPVVRGMRITVKTVLEYLAAGDSVENILQAYPQLEKEDIQACLQFALRSLGSRVSLIELAC